MLVLFVVSVGSIAVWAPTILAGAEPSSPVVDIGRTATAAGTVLFMIAMALVGTTSSMSEFLLGGFLLLRVSAIPVAVALRHTKAASIATTAAILTGLAATVTLDQLAPAILLALTCATCIAEQHALLSTIIKTVQ